MPYQHFAHYQLDPILCCYLPHSPCILVDIHVLLLTIHRRAYACIPQRREYTADRNKPTCAPTLRDVTATRSSGEPTPSSSSRHGSCPSLPRTRRAHTSLSAPDPTYAQRPMDLGSGPSFCWSLFWPSSWELVRAGSV